MTVSREFNCFKKMLTVCKNRGFTDVGSEVLKKIAPRYLSDKELSGLTSVLPKNITYAHKLTFIEQSLYPNSCIICREDIPKDAPIFLNGKDAYHIPCALETNLAGAKDHLYFQKWVSNSKTKNDHPKKK